MSANTSLFNVTVASSAVERPGRYLDQRGAAVGRMRNTLDEAVTLQPADGVRHAGHVYLQPLGCLRDGQGAAGAEGQQP